MEVVYPRRLQAELAEHLLSLTSLQPEVAALQQVGDPIQEPSERLREYDFYIFVATEEDHLAHSPARPRVEIEAYVIA